MATAVVAFLALLPETQHAVELEQARRVAAVAARWQLYETREPGVGVSCTVVSPGRHVSARLTRRADTGPPVWSVRVGYDSQPGSVRYLRVNAAYFTSAEPSFRGKQANAIVTLLKGPGVFAFEWARRPDFVKRQGLYGTGDFSAGATECERRLTRTPA